MQSRHTLDVADMNNRRAMVAEGCLGRRPKDLFVMFGQKPVETFVQDGQLPCRIGGLKLAAHAWPRAPISARTARRASGLARSSILAMVGVAILARQLPLAHRIAASGKVACTSVA